MTKLQSYLTEVNLRQGDLAAQVGTTQAHISKLASGAARPSLDLAFAIEKATGGAVPVASWNPDPAPQEAVPQTPTEDAA